MKTITVARRFCGPPRSGNGGYVCGLAAGLVGGEAEVTLRTPPPLDTPLRVTREAGAVRIFDQNTLVAEARAARPDLVVPAAPTHAEAEIASAGYRGHEGHAFPTCFVCGPERAPHEALCIFAGAMDGHEVVSAAWTPSPDLAGCDGLVAEEFLWAALDCPSYWALPAAGAKAAVLGRLTAVIENRPEPGIPVIVAAWALGGEGRKLRSASAIYSVHGAVLAYAEALWIELKAT